MQNQLIDRELPIPLYYQLQNILLQQVKSCSPGDELPSAREIMEEYGVSRITVQRALNELVREGYINRQPGKGNFVAKKLEDTRAERLTGFLEEQQKLGLKIGSRTLFIGQKEAPPAIFEKLDLVPGEATFLIQRVGIVEDEPVAVSDLWLALPKRFELYEESLSQHEVHLVHTFIESIFLQNGIQLPGGEKTLEATIATSREADLLNINLGDPMMLVHVTMRSQDNRNVVYVKAIYRGDRYLYTTKLYK